MSSIELTNVLFRGRREGATGQAKFKLTAKSIDAVDTLNLKNGHVTYSYLYSYTNLATTSFTVNLPIQDSNVYCEIIAYGEGMTNVYVNGNNQLLRMGRHPSHRPCPFCTIVGFGPGTHTVALARSTADSASGFIFARYIRRTGSDNL